MKIVLQFFNDDATGEYGVTHQKTVGEFNPFWSGDGFFHDVFEHYFELEHPYFMGDYGLNLGGEIAAMGHAAWYGMVGLRDMRFGSKMYGFESSIVRTTYNDMAEAIMYGYSNYGDTLTCKVPYQKFVDYNSECIINDHLCMLEELKEKNKLQQDDHYDSDQEKQWAKRYSRSCTESKITRLYRWGYKQAQKICPSHNQSDVLREFIEYWDLFCKENPAANIQLFYKNIVFDVIKGINLKWDCHFVTKNNELIHYTKAEEYMYSETT